MLSLKVQHYNTSQSPFTHFTYLTLLLIVSYKSLIYKKSNIKFVLKN